jgi:hypothetical protein
MPAGRGLAGRRIPRDLDQPVGRACVGGPTPAGRQLDVKRGPTRPSPGRAARWREPAQLAQLSRRSGPTSASRPGTPGSSRASTRLRSSTASYSGSLRRRPLGRRRGCVADSRRPSAGPGHGGPQAGPAALARRGRAGRVATVAQAAAGPVRTRGGRPAHAGCRCRRPPVVQSPGRRPHRARRGRGAASSCGSGTACGQHRDLPQSTGATATQPATARPPTGLVDDVGQPRRPACRLPGPGRDGGAGRRLPSHRDAVSATRLAAPIASPLRKPPSTGWTRPGAREVGAEAFEVPGAGAAPP